MLIWSIGLVMACPEGEQVSVAGASTGETVVVQTLAAAHSAQSSKLLGANCPYSTGIMAQRVLEEGGNWSYQGPVSPFSGNLDSMVSCPYTTSDTEIHIIATEFLEAIQKNGFLEQLLHLEGKSLEVDGVRYVVITSFRILKP